MAGTIINDGEDTCVQHPQHKSRPTTVLLKHSEAPALPSQQKHVEEFCAAEAARQAAEIQIAVDWVWAQPLLNSSESHCATPSDGSSIPPSPGRQSIHEFDSDDGYDNAEHEDARSNPKPGKRHLFKTVIIINVATLAKQPHQATVEDEDNDNNGGVLNITASAKQQNSCWCWHAIHSWFWTHSRR
jgi:hypothetical protein